MRRMLSKPVATRWDAVVGAMVGFLMGVGVLAALAAFAAVSISFVETLRERLTTAVDIAGVEDAETTDETACLRAKFSLTARRHGVEDELSLLSGQPSCPNRSRFPG